MGRVPLLLIMDSPQTILKDRIIQILGPTGNNTLSWVKYPVGSGYQYESGCWIGDRRGTLPATHGIAVNIDGMAQYEPGNYSPSQHRDVIRCGFTMDLWTPQDLNATAFATDSSFLVGQGKTMPVVIESMDISGKLILRALKDMRIFQSVRMLPPLQRGVYNNSPTLERARVNLVFCPEICIKAIIA
jgi:hypothetical protein